MSDPEGRIPTDQRALGQLSWTALTDPGRFRKHNEDAFLALTFDALEVLRLGKIGQGSLRSGDYIFAVSDGMGGHKAGDFASRIAVEKIAELFPRVFLLDALRLRRGSSDLLEQLFDDIHREIRHLGACYDELSDMGATLSLCWFRPDWMYFCHIGDSRIYYLPKAGGIKQITEDHSHVGWLVKTGQITPAQARFHPARNQLSQALTAGSESIHPQLGSVGYEAGDRFVICSDGLTDGLSDNGIAHLLRDQPPHVNGLPAADALVQESIAGSGKDNTTAVVIEVLEPPE